MRSAILGNNLKARCCDHTWFFRRTAETLVAYATSLSLTLSPALSRISLNSPFNRKATGLYGQAEHFELNFFLSKNLPSGKVILAVGQFAQWLALNESLDFIVLCLEITANEGCSTSLFIKRFTVYSLMDFIIVCIIWIIKTGHIITQVK